MPVKKLSWDEMQRRPAQGLCFNCNDKFTAGHKCTRAQLLIMDNEVEMDENTNEEPTRGVNQIDLDESKDLQITSMHSRVGQSLKQCACWQRLAPTKSWF